MRKLFLIVLVISISFFSNQAFGQQLTEIQFVSGSQVEILTNGLATLDVSTAASTGGAIHIYARSTGTGIYVASSTNNVGIGTTAPVAKLQVSNETLANTSGQHTLYLTENNNTESSGGLDITKPYYGIGFRRLWAGGGATNIAGIYGYGSVGYRGGLVFKTNNTGSSGSEPNIFAMTIQPDGNVGIGTSTPATELHVYSVSGNAATFNQPITIGYPSASTDAARKDYVDNTFAPIGGTAGVWKLSSNNLYASSTSYNVAIGTSTPAGKLHVAGIGYSDQNAGLDSATNPTTTTAGGLILDGGYSNGLYRTRLVKIDRTGNLPLYIQGSTGSTAFSNIARFGSHTYSTNVFEVFGNTAISGSVTIGAPVASSTLWVNGDITAHGGEIIFADNGTSNREYITSNDSGITGINAVGVFGFYADGTLGTAITSPSAGISVNGIYSAGNIGIGTTTTTQSLTINGGDIDFIRGDTSAIHSLGSISFDWTSGTYDTPTLHGIESKDEAGTFNDDVRINSYSDLIATIDSNANSTSYFKVEKESNGGNGTDLFTLDEAGAGTFLSTVTAAYPTLSTHLARKDYVDTVAGIAQSASWVQSGNNLYASSTSWNVGIGTTAPVTKLEVNGAETTNRISQSASGSTYTELATRSWGGNNAIFFGAYATSSYINGDFLAAGNTKHKYAASAFGSADHRAKAIIADHSGIGLYVSGVSGGADQNVTWNQELLVTPSSVYIPTNSVGIGAVTPSSKLDIRDAGTTIPALGTVGTGLSILRTDGAAGVSIGYENATGDTYIQSQRTDSAVAYDLLLQPRGGNVGIGNTSPSSKLDVKNTTTGSAIRATVTDGAGSTDFGYGFYIDNQAHELAAVNAVYQTSAGGGSGDLIFKTRNAGSLTEKMRVTSNGNIGIGTTAPTGQKVLINSDQGSTGNSALQILYSGGTSILGEVSALAHRNSVWDALYVNGTGSSLTNSVYVEGDKPFIINGPNVGIGTTNPQTKLDIVNGAPDTYANRTASIAFHRSDLLTSYSNRITNSMSSAVADTTMNFELTNGAGSGYVTPLTLVGNGNVGIGTSTPATELHVYSASGNAATFNQPITIGYPSASTDAATKSYVDTVAGIAQSASWVQSGSNLYASSTSWKVGVGNTNPTYRLQLGTSGSLTDSIRIGTYAVAKNTRQYIGYAREDSGLFESAGDGDTASTVKAGVSGIRIVNSTGTLASAQADNSVQLLTHIYNGNSRVALHANYDGNIGIGNTSPGGVLHISGGSNANPTLRGSYGSMLNSHDEWLRINNDDGGTPDYHTSGIYMDGPGVGIQNGLMVGGSSLPAVGHVTATQFNGSGAGLTSVPWSSLSGSPIVNTSGSGASVRNFTIKESADSQISFGYYAGSWRSSIQIQSNDATKLLFLTSPESDYGYSIIRSAAGGLKIDVGGTITDGGTNGLTIETSGNVSIGGGIGVNSAGTTEGYWLDGKAALTGESADNWLRINQSSSWTNGVYTPGVFRADGGIVSGGTSSQGAGTILATGNIYMNNQTVFGLKGNSLHADTINTGTTNDPLEINYVTAGPTKICASASCATVSAIFDTSGNVQMGNGAYSSGAVLSLGSSSVDYPASSGWNTTWNSNLLLSGATSTSISFHDAGLRVDKIRAAGGMFYIGENAGWGAASVTIGGDLTVSGGDLTVTKLNADTVDPPYTIGGKKYATYMAGMTGLKEETSGVVKLKDSKATLDLLNFEEGSDLWLFAKTTNLENKGLDGLIVILTPNFKGDVWYEKIDNKLIIRSSEKSGEVSYRLTAPRFDHETNGSNRRTDFGSDGNPNPEGLNLDKLIK